MGLTNIRIAVSTTQTDLASQAAGLLEALTRDHREWIAGRATPALRRALKDPPADSNGPLAVFITSSSTRHVLANLFVNDITDEFNDPTP